jgi:hypothetical protein
MNLDSLVANRQLSQAGLDWMTIALDPFHDTEMNCPGFPDLISSKSIVQCITQTVNVTNTASAYDCHIFFLPCSQIWSANIWSNQLLRTLITPDGFIAGTQTGPILNPGLNVLTTFPGVSWYSSTAGTNFPEAGLPLSFGAGQTRLVAVGWEVVNTTPVTLMQGSVTAYKSPNTFVNSVITSGGEFVSDATVSYPIQFGALPPGTQTDAALFPNSRTWQASEGLYQIATLNETQNPYASPVPGLAGFMTVPNETDLLDATPNLAYIPTLNDAATALPIAPIIAYPYASNHGFPWDVSGAVFAGLSAQSTLQVTVKYYVERIPTISDPNLLVLCRQPPSYDPLALEIYSRVVAKLPVGCKVDENPLGEWFDTVMDIVAAGLPIVGSSLAAIFPPAAALGAALGVTAAEIRKMNKDARDKNLKQSTAVLVNSKNGGSTVTVKQPSQAMRRRGAGAR